MKKTFELLKEDFESSTTRTPQYLNFHKVFKKEFIALLKDQASKIEISKPNHFDISGFFQIKEGTIYYFSISDLRWSKDKMLIREAESFSDYTGGSNYFIALKDSESFRNKLFNFLSI